MNINIRITHKQELKKLGCYNGKITGIINDKLRKDEGDNHLIELAVAGQAKCIISRNTKDLINGELLFPEISILTPSKFLQQGNNKP